MLRKDGKLVADPWDAGAHAARAEARRRCRARGKAGNAVFINQHETGSFPGFLDAWLAGYGMPAHLSYDAERRRRRHRGEHAELRRRVAALDFTAAKLDRLVRRRLPRDVGRRVPQQLSFADARAKGADAPRFVYIGAAPLAHRA